ncbi:MAG: hypothetical protein HW380_1464 [Magnetococcales bacterium]|nr:hypothetical protein [Magnetococcales bacterium]HIJ85284.1 hypothetical protein [Magnetococcales bacterium]
MAIPLISEEDLQRNRMAFAIRRKVAVRQETEKLERMIDREAASRLHKGISLPYTIPFQIPEGIVSRKEQGDFLDADDYFLSIATELREIYRKAGWASKVKRVGEAVHIMLDRPKPVKANNPEVSAA